MTSCITTILLFSIFLLFSACGSELETKPRETLSPYQLTQNYQARLFVTSGGVTNYIITATFKTSKESGSRSLPLPAEDTLSLNGLPLSYSPDLKAYLVKGNGDPGQMTFTWKSGEQTFVNTMTASLYPLAMVPLELSKSAGIRLTIPDAYSPVTATASVNSGTSVAEPFYDIPISLNTIVDSNSGADLTTLRTGPGVLNVLEKTESALQDPSALGGSMTSIVQYGYNLTIVP